MPLNGKRVKQKTSLSSSRSRKRNSDVAANVRLDQRKSRDEGTCTHWLAAWIDEELDEETKNELHLSHDIACFRTGL